MLLLKEEANRGEDTCKGRRKTPEWELYVERVSEVNGGWLSMLSRQNQVLTRGQISVRSVGAVVRGERLSGGGSI